MRGIAAGIAMTLGVCAAQGADEPEGLLERFLPRIGAELQRLPDYVCTQTVQRLSRSSADRPWIRADTLKLEVAIVGERELYALPGAPRFDDTPLADLVGRGTITTGQLGGFAKHVFNSSATQFMIRGASEENDRPAFQFGYDVPPEKSSYRLRAGTVEAIVGFQGEFWIDRATLDLLRLEVQAYDIPEALGLADAHTSLRYSRVRINDGESLLPVEATFAVAGTDGMEDLNRTTLSDCRQYRIESTLQVSGAPVVGEAERVTQPLTDWIGLPSGALLELALESSLDPETAALGDTIRARVARPLKAGQEVLVPEGAVALARLVRLERETVPFPIYEIGLELQSLQVSDSARPIFATLEETGPARGLLRQTKRLEPTFSSRRRPRLEILVPEIQRGQGIIRWDARRLPIPRGLRMAWRIESEAPRQDQQ